MKVKTLNSQENNILLYTVVVDAFMSWKNKLYSEIRGEKLMFDVPKHYKWLDENELFDY